MMIVEVVGLPGGGAVGHGSGGDCCCDRGVGCFCLNDGGCDSSIGGVDGYVLLVAPAVAVAIMMTKGWWPQY